MSHPHSLPPLHPTDRLVGTCPAIATLRTQIRHLAAFDTLGNPAVPTVLLQGETGTGKGLVARVLHDSGPRAQGPFLDVNCAAIPETLLEAELFGVTAGAFTDAKRTKPGLFEAAVEGTLFLDEIDALPLTLQGKLLTAIEAKRVRRVGAVREQAVDVKVVAATQADLSAHVAAGQFRADLYYRLAVLVLALPSLRERGADIVLLAQKFLHEYAKAHQLLPKRLSRAAAAWLRRHDWPGNVRELSHLMERVTLLSPEALIDPQTLERLCLPRMPAAAHAAAAPAAAEEQPLDEAARITQALRQTQGNVVQAARILGLSRKALRYRMRRYGLARPSGEGQDEGTAVRRDTEDAAVPTPAWEQKLVAVLAIEVTWPAALEPDTLHYEPWTAHGRWEQTVMEKVQGFGGVVLQRGPSLLLVAFGLPHTLDQLPHRAVQTALGIQQMTAEGLAAGERAPRPVVRQAVHWGQVLVDGGARDPTARVLPIAETLAEPVRWLGQAEPGEIRVTAPVRRLIEGWCEVQACAKLLGARHGDQAGAYTVIGLKPQRSLLALYGQRPLSQFVGRTRELALLTELLGHVAEAHGHVVGLVGEAGVGKSRLVYELILSHQTRGWMVLESAAVSYGTMTPYFPVIDLLRRYAHVEACDDAHTIRAKVAEQVRSLDATLQDTLPALLALLDALPEDDPFLTLDPPQRRQRTLDACKRVVLRESQVQPLLLVCEDLHWIDAGTQTLLDTLVESLPRARLLVLVTYRPEYQHGWGSKTYYTQVRLDPLPPGSADEFLHALLGDDSSLAPLTQLLIARTEGNPFFLEESVRTLVETRVLMGEPRAYHLAQALPTMQVPTTVLAVLAARIDRLPPEEKRLLQTAAVVGTDVPFALLQAIADVPEAVLHRGLAHLQAAEFLYETRLFPVPEYTFKHAMTHEVAYDSLVLERRRALHARIVEASERLYADRLTEQAAQLAHHAMRGEVWDKALCYYRQAGAKAEARSAYREAVMCFEQALGALQHLPDGRETMEQAIDLRFNLRNALLELGDHKPILEYLRQAEPLAQALGDQRRLGWVLSYLTRHLADIGGYDRTIISGERALAIAEDVGDVNLQVVTQCLLGQAYHFLGDYRRALDVLKRNVASLAGELRYERFGLPYPASVHTRTWLILSLAELGAFAEGSARSEEECQIAEAVNQPSSVVHARFSTGFLHLRQGDLHKATPVLERGRELCQVWNFRVHWHIIAACLGYAYALSGRVAEAVLLLEQALGQVASTIYIKGWNALCEVYLSEAYVLAGRREEALQLAERTLADASEQNLRGKQAWTLRLLGIIHAQSNPPAVELAEASYCQALALAEELGMRPLQAHCHLGLGTLYARIGRREQAHLELATAIELYRAMDMTFWLPQAEAALAQVE